MAGEGGGIPIPIVLFPRKEKSGGGGVSYGQMERQRIAEGRGDIASVYPEVRAAAFARLEAERAARYVPIDRLSAIGPRFLGRRLGSGMLSEQKFGPVTPTPPATPGPGVSGTLTQIGDMLDAGLRGLARGLNVYSMIEYLRSLFAGPGQLPTGGFDPMAMNFVPANYGDFMGGPSSLGGALGGVASIINAIRGNQAMPGGFGFMPSLVASQQNSMLNLGAGGCPVSPFADSATSSVRAQAFVATHPVSGKAVWFKPAGRPLLWSGDLSACRRVRKIAGRARRRLGGR